LDYGREVPTTYRGSGVVLEAQGAKKSSKNVKKRLEETWRVK
jgi:hypothetical protein